MAHRHAILGAKHENSAGSRRGRHSIAAMKLWVKRSRWFLKSGLINPFPKACPPFM